MTDDELAHLGLRAIRDRLEAGELSSAELTDALLDRIERVDRDAIRAVIETNPQALDEAHRADDTADPRGPLHGVPVLIKDNIDTAAPLHTTAGSLAMAGDHVSRDATLVRSLRAAGAIVLGKTNLSEWANYRSPRSTSGWSAVGGLTVNPHDPQRSAGGSSSGSGAALAAGLAPLTIGTETDGSISCPAALNGVVGLKPTVGLIPRTGVVPISATQDTPGPMARSVLDAAALLSVLAGIDPADPGTSRAGRPQPQDYTTFCRPGRLNGIRLGVPTGTTLFGYHRGLDAVTRRALDVLADLGAELVENVALPGLQNGGAELTVLDHEFKAHLETYLAGRPDCAVSTIAELIAFNDEHADEELRWFDQENLRRVAELGGLDEPAYLEARDRARTAATTDGIDGALQQHDVHALVMPCYVPAWSNDLVLGDGHTDGCSTLPAMAGYPLFSVPSGTVPGPVAPLPVALALTAGAWSEPVLFRIAAAYEAVVTGREDSDGSICPRPSSRASDTSR